MQAILRPETSISPIVSLFNNVLATLGFHESVADPFLFISIGSKGILLLVSYVDDLLVVGSKGVEIQKFILAFKERLKGKEQKLLSKFLRMKISDTGKPLKREHHHMINRMLKLFNTEDCHSVACRIHLGTSL